MGLRKSLVDNFLDRFLDRFTSYRLVLYCLYGLVGWGVIAAAAGRLPFKWYELVLSAVFLLLICRLSSWLTARFMGIPKNHESDQITALILTLIMAPPKSAEDYVVLAIAGLGAIFSKYLINFRRWHLFNPAASGAFLAGLLSGHYASWWVGASVMLPFSLIAGTLILRKIKRFIMAGVFLIVYLCVMVLNSGISTLADNPGHLLYIWIVVSPLIFFTDVMLTEPLTSPTQLRKYVPYAILVSVLFSWNRLKLSPEEALLLGNLFGYIIAPAQRLKLKLVGIQQEAAGLYTFVFSKPKKFSYTAGQYMEWTLPNVASDSRGNRRYLTLASSPTESSLAFSVKIPDKSSSFKTQLQKLKARDPILAAQLSGSFTLPADKQVPLAFIAGGIGVTPFRSIIKYLIDKKEPRDVSLFYSATTPDELAYQSLFTKAAKAGFKINYSVTHPTSDWTGLRGPIGKSQLAKAIPDFESRLFYISGPYGFVQAARKALYELGVRPANIKTDYFPGYG